jgi:hypothetical protein
VPDIKKELTIEAWIAPQEYSWNWSAIDEPVIEYFSRKSKEKRKQRKWTEKHIQAMSA